MQLSRVAERVARFEVKHLQHAVENNAVSLRRYFSFGNEEQQKKKKNYRVRAFVTFSIRDETKVPKARLGNEFGLVAVDLPTHLECPTRRLQESSGRMTCLKKSREPHGVAALLSCRARAWP